jgi:hypothetical protein
MGKDVYVPFDDPKLMFLGSRVATANSGRCFGPFNPLGHVTTLIILAHSGVGEGLLYSNSGATIDATTLAKTMVKDLKLSRNCTSIDLMACEAGHPMRNFATELQDALQKCGLTNVTVEGYSSIIKVTRRDGQAEVAAVGLRTPEGKTGNRFAKITGVKEGSGKREKKMR